jgi:hypothetical protein
MVVAQAREQDLAAAIARIHVTNVVVLLSQNYIEGIFLASFTETQCT